MIANRPNTSLENTNLVRLLDPQTNHYLHLSGKGLTPTEKWAWLGTRSQGNTLMQRALARGEDWPFLVIRRDENEVWSLAPAFGLRDITQGAS